MFQVAISHDDNEDTYTVLPILYRHFSDAHAFVKRTDPEHMIIVKACEKYWAFSLLDTSRPLEYVVND